MLKNAKKIDPICVEKVSAKFDAFSPRKMMKNGD
jgi:hypothetical protein